MSGKVARQALGGALVLLALSVLGCGRGDKLSPVSGQVFWQGRPLPGGTIVFTPDADRGGHGPLACGEIGADGRYHLTSADQPGAGAGWYRVTIAAAAPGAPLSLPAAYSDPQQSGLLREVPAGKPCQHDFYLEAKE